MIEQFKIDNYLLSFKKSTKKETFKCSSYYGITFYIDNDRYEILHNYNLGNRLLINNQDGWKDVPFSKKTFFFLPDEILIRIV